jgi:hypothetical protein
MTDINLGTCPVAIRQKLKRATTFSGAAPHLNGPPIVTFVPHYSNGIYVYSDEVSVAPDDEADEAGLFLFGEQPAEIVAIHLDIADHGTEGDINITIADSDGSCVRTIAALLTLDNYYWTPSARTFVLPYQMLKVSQGAVAGTKAAGYKHATIYVVKAYVAGLV